MYMQVKSVMSRNPEVLSLNATLRQAADEMQKHDCGFLPIGDNGEIAGVITDRDLALRAIAQGKDPNKILVKDIMTKKVLFCKEDDDVKTVAHNMGRDQIRRLVVLDKGSRIAGVISLGDIARKCHDAALCGQTMTEISQTKH